MVLSVFNTRRYIVLDSGFFFFKGLVELRWNGLFGAALIKKCRWSTTVPVNAMKHYFLCKKPIYVDAIESTAVAKDNILVQYTLWEIQEPEYVRRMMATGGALRADDSWSTMSR
jgi:hypothetical protein